MSPHTPTPTRRALLSTVRSARALALLLGLLPIFSACATKQIYSGRTPAPGETAQITPSFGIAGTQIVLESIDGVALGWQHDRASVLPGHHVLRAHMVLRSGLHQQKHAFELPFDAEAGGSYLVFGELAAHGPRLWLTDPDLRTVADSDDDGMLPSVSAGPGTATAASGR